MQALAHRGPYAIRVQEKAVPRIGHPNDATLGVALAVLPAVAVVGADGSWFGTVQFGDAPAVGLTIRGNRAPVQRRWSRRFEHIRNGYPTPSDIVTRRVPLEHIADGHHIFSAELDDCSKVLAEPDAA